MRRLSERHCPAGGPVAVPSPSFPIWVRANSGGGRGTDGDAEMGGRHIRWADLGLPDGEAWGVDRGDRCLRFGSAAGGSG